MERGKFIVIDGIDASGKGVIERKIKEYELSLERKIFDAVDFSLKNNKLPELKEFENCSTLFTCEPSYCGIGKTIREIVIHKEKGLQYSADDKIDFYGCDRLINMYELVLPAIERGINVVQTRSLGSTLAYQVLENLQIGIDSDKTKKQIMKHKGNKVLINHPPDLLIIPSITDGKEVEKRVDKRKIDGKDDNCMFETADFQTKLSSFYGSDDFRKFFELIGTTVEYIDATISPEYTAKRALEVYINFLK